MTKDTCLQHTGNQDLIDSFSDAEIIKLWFDKENECAGQACSSPFINALMDKSAEMASLIMETLPNRMERTRALTKLQEVIMWSCAGVRRGHAVNNILQVRRGRREIAEMEDHKCTCNEKEK